MTPPIPRTSEAVLKVVRRAGRRESTPPTPRTKPSIPPTSHTSSPICSHTCLSSPRVFQKEPQSGFHSPERPRIPLIPKKGSEGRSLFPHSISKGAPLCFPQYLIRVFDKSLFSHSISQGAPKGAVNISKGAPQDFKRGAKIFEKGRHSSVPLHARPCHGDRARSRADAGS